MARFSARRPGITKTAFATTVILCLSALAAPAALAQTGAAQCIAAYVPPGSTHATIYVSQVVPTPAQAAALNGAWGDFVKSSYHLEKLASATCQPFSADPATQQRVLSAEQNAWTKNGMQVVQVNWQPGQHPGPNPKTNPYGDSTPAPNAAPKDAPADATPPANLGPPPRASYCYSDDAKPTVYFSGPFDTADLPSSTAWSTAFSKFLAQKYMYKGTVTCKDQATIVKVLSEILDQKDTLQGKEKVDTGWTYEPPAPGQAPPPDAAPLAATPKPATRKPQ